MPAEFNFTNNKDWLLPFLEYFKDTYTHKKTKDLVNTQISKYQQMMAEMQENVQPESTSISTTEIQTMDDDLTKYMEEQMCT